MSKCERPTAQSAIPRQSVECLAIAFLQTQATFHVGKLPDIIVPAAFDDIDRAPAKEVVGGALDHSLSDDDAPPLLLDRSFAVEMPRQYGFARFLDLQEQGTIGTLLLEQHNPATGADAAHANNLARDVDDPVARQQSPAIL